MPWTNDNGPEALAAAEEALLQAQRAELAAISVEDVIAESEQVTLENKIIPLTTVDTVALRDSTYPNPLNGSLVTVNQGANGNAETYRFATGTGWVLVDKYNGTTITNITAQLAEKVSDTELAEVVAVNINNYSNLAVGTDWTAALQAAIDTRKPVKIPRDKIYRITDSIKIYPNTIIIADENPSVNYPAALTKVVFSPSTKKDMFVWATTPTTYNYGVKIQGLAIQGEGTNGRYVFNLTNALGLRISDIRVYSGFDYGVNVGDYVDALYENCSFMGLRETCVTVFKSSYICTSTTFRNCYFSHSKLGYSVEGDAINSLMFDDCIFESLDMMCDVGVNNNVFMNNLYMEHTPQTDINGPAIKLGFTGDKTAYKCGSFVLSGKTCMGLNNAFPANTTFMSVDHWKNVSISDTYILRQGTLLKTTLATEQVSLTNVYTENIDLFAVNGGIADWSKIVINGGNLVNMYRSLSDAIRTNYQNMTSEIFLNERDESSVSYGKVFLDKVDKRLKYKDGKNNLRNMSSLSASSASATFNGAKLQAGEVIWNNANKPVTKGQPLGWVSRWYSRDTQALLLDGITTSGSPIVSSAANTFFDFVVNDYVRLSAGMPSTTIQYRILSISTDKKSITLDTNATSSATGVTVDIPAHLLMPFGQIDYRTSTAAPSVTPFFVGEELLDTTNGKWYKSKGLTASDWVAPATSNDIVYTIATPNAYTAAQLITAFPVGKTTVFRVNNPGGAGFPYNAAGICTVYNFGVNGIDRQEFRPLDKNELWGRYTDGTGAWTPFVKMSV